MPQQHFHFYYNVNRMDNSILHVITAHFHDADTNEPYVQKFDLPSVAKRIIGISCIFNGANGTGLPEVELVLNDDRNHLVIEAHGVGDGSGNILPGLQDANCEIIPNSHHMLILYNIEDVTVTLKLLT